MANQNALEKSSSTELTRPTSIVAKSVQNLVAENRLHLPVNYSYQNALQEAELFLRANPNLMNCSKESICNSLMAMTVSGLSLGKGQGYLIGYDKTLQFQRSYFGDQALAERLRPGINIFSDVIYEGEKFSTKKIHNKYGFITVVNDHEQPFPRKSGNIIGVYTGAVDAQGEYLPIELMDSEQVHNSWKKSKQYNPQSKTFHNEQPDLAFKRTCIRRWSTKIIKTSDDEVLLSALRANDEGAIEAEFDEVVEQNQGKEVLAMSAPSPTFTESQPEQMSEKVQQTESVEKLPKANKTPMDEVREAKAAPSQVVDESTGEVHEQTSLMEDEPAATQTGRPGY